MKYLTGKEEKIANEYLKKAIIVAREATCERAKCGAVIVKNGEIIGKGFNSPPDNDDRQRRCKVKKDNYDQKVTDKTCCVHAEQRAVMDSLSNNPKKIIGASLYFVRFYPDGVRRLLGESVKLYCTICSKIMFDVGIKKFVLAHQDGICSYSNNEYINESFNYKK